MNLGFNKKTGLAIVVIGLLGIFVSLLVTANFAAKFILSDHHITPLGVEKLQTYRILLAAFGTFLVVIGTIFIFIPIKKILTLFNNMVPSKKIFLLLIVGSFLFVTGTISQNVNNPDLWFDEAGQFWISQGLNHYSAPLQNPAGIASIIENNAIHNLDPGGFSILLRLWSQISNAYPWLRLLPLLFLIGTISLFIYLSYKWTGSFSSALLVGFIPLLFSNVVFMGSEVRAYSMEYFGVILGVAAIYSIQKKLSYGNLFLWGVVLSFFLTSRYSIIITTFSCSLYIIYLIVRSRLSNWNKFKSIFIYALPILITLTCIYLFTLRIQNPEIIQLFYLPYLIDYWKLLIYPSNHLIYMISILSLFVILIYALKSKKSTLQKYLPVLFVAVSSNIIFILISFLGKYPWVPLDKRGLPYFILTLLCGTALIGEIFTRLMNLSNKLVYLSVGLTYYCFCSSNRISWHRGVNQQT